MPAVARFQRSRACRPAWFSAMLPGMSAWKPGHASASSADEQLASTMCATYCRSLALAADCMASKSDCGKGGMGRAGGARRQWQQRMACTGGFGERAAFGRACDGDAGPGCWLPCIIANRSSSARPTWMAARVSGLPSSAARRAHSLWGAAVRICTGPETVRANAATVARSAIAALGACGHSSPVMGASGTCSSAGMAAVPG